MTIARRPLLVTLFAGALPYGRGREVAAAPLPALPLPGLWPDGLDPAPYLVSEKYDGVRGHWDGTTLRFRSGRTVAAPAWFTAGLPRRPLDGELWLGRGRFDELSAIVRRERPVDAQWRQLRYMVFELPDEPGSFAERARRIAAIARLAGTPWLVAAEQRRIADRMALGRRLAQTVAQRGEGLVLHLATAPWRVGRSETMFKLKPSLDAEAVVVAYRPGRGKYEGRVGALEVRSPDGRHFLLGSGLDDALRSDPPPLGSVVTYRYRELAASGLPRFASFTRMHTPL